LIIDIGVALLILTTHDIDS